MATMRFELEITELRLGLPGEKNEKKRMFSEMNGEDYGGETEIPGRGDTKVEEKSNGVAIGWPPVCSYRRRNSIGNEKECVESSKITMVKISMDGVPFLRKIDVSSYKGYFDLLESVKVLFGCHGIGEALKNGENSEYVPIYEDKDGDWLLVGDVPWKMFVESCKRLRVMKKSEAKTLKVQSKKFVRG